MTADLGPGPGLEAEAARGRRAWLAVPLALAAGWGAFLAYGTAFLTEEAPRPPARAAERESPAIDFPAAGAGAMQAARRAAYGLDEPARPAAAPAVEVTAAPTQTAATLPPPPSPVARLDHVGVWGPNAAACGAPNRRRGFYQATITAEGARAGRTICTFRDGRRMGNAWVTAAECRDRGRRWSSQVRLVVEGDRLTWSSARGTSSYIRCGRRAG